MPLSFEEGVGRPQISDRQRFKGVVRTLKEQPRLKIELTGHTCAPGEVSNNFKLGMLRARMTKRLLVRRGISPRRVKLRSRGEREPIDSSGSNPINRRVEARIIH
jgi:outer membrane protein OmpA-like peptidoglycan-associated protein